MKAQKDRNRRRYFCFYFSLGCFLLFSLATGGACSHFRQLLGLIADKPEVKLSQIDVESFRIDRIQLVFVLDIVNPNDFALDFSELEYKVRGLGIELGEGQATAPFSLAASQQTKIRLPFTVKPEAAFALFKKYLSQPKELRLHFDAHLFMDTAFGKMDMHFQDERTMVKGLKAY